mmetsp:Transcript_30309/g.48734  ORF Transcript_30309/g.48734 Transcript_30309/m.48734 type:complete len:108 (+) Transcript_30309:388-711(+)
MLPLLEAGLRLKGGCYHPTTIPLFLDDCQVHPNRFGPPLASNRFATASTATEIAIQPPVTSLAAALEPPFSSPLPQAQPFVEGPPPRERSCGPLTATLTPQSVLSNE